MGFKIVEGSPKADWFPVSCYSSPTVNTAYVGQIVSLVYDGVLTPGAAGAGPDVTSYPFGIVIATNNRTPVFNTTYNAEYVSSCITQATLATRDFAFHEGMTHKGERQAMVKVAILDPTCVIEGPIRNAAIGTAPGVVTCTTASTDGLESMVHGNADVALLANNNMYFCRSGANMGIYRKSYAASQTTPTFYSPWPEDWAVGDTFVAANVGIGRQKVDFDAAGMWIENSAALTNYYLVDVLSMNLETAGAEAMQFKFARQGY